MNIHLQKAYNKLMTSKAQAGTIEYSRTWQNYLKHGGTLDMRPKGIDLDEYKDGHHKPKTLPKEKT